MPTKRLLCLLLGLVLLSGCSGGAKVLIQAEGYDFEEMQLHPWAIGGMALRTGLDVDGAAGKELEPLLEDELGLSVACSSMLYSGILRTAPEMELWAFGTVQELVPQALLKSYLSDIELSRQPDPSDLKKLSLLLPEVEYIVFGRLDDTRLLTDQDVSSRVTDQMNKDGRDPHANSLSRTATLRRGVFMSMEIYSLQKGELVWSGKADHWDEVFISSSNIEQMGNIQVLKEGDDSEETRLQMDGTIRKSPGLLDGMRECCVSLAAEMKSRHKESSGSETLNLN